MIKVATSLLLNKEGKVLILKRSNKVSTYRGFWAGISGYVEEKEDPYDTAIKEIIEETGINEQNISLIKKLDPIEFNDTYKGIIYNWKIFTFIFKFEKKEKINIDWEHSEYRWIPPSEIHKYDTVPRLKEIVSKIFL